MAEFVTSSTIPKEDCLYIYEGASIQLRGSLHFNKSSALSTTYLGRKPTKYSDPFSTEESFSIHANSHFTGQLPNGEEVDILIDTGASKSLCPNPFTLVIVVCTLYPIYH